MTAVAPTGIVQLMPPTAFPSLCGKATSEEGCAHIQCLAILRLSRMPCTACGEAVAALGSYVVLSRGPHGEPMAIAHASCVHGVVS